VKNLLHVAMSEPALQAQSEDARMQDILVGGELEKIIEDPILIGARGLLTHRYPSASSCALIRSTCPKKLETIGDIQHLERTEQSSLKHELQRSGAGFARAGCV
jgi:hypothetical protein